MRYFVFWYNFGYYAQDHFASSVDAMHFAQSRGFQYRIDEFEPDNNGKLKFRRVVPFHQIY